MEVVFLSEDSRQGADRAFPPAQGRIGGGADPCETTENLFCGHNWDSEVWGIATKRPLGSQPAPTWDFTLYKMEEPVSYLETK